MAIEEDKVREALKQVIDPELFVNCHDGPFYQRMSEEWDAMNPVYLY